MYIEDGVRSWWRGNSAMMARVLPFAAVQFMSHEQYKQLFRRDRSGRYDIDILCIVCVPVCLRANGA